MPDQVRKVVAPPIVVDDCRMVRHRGGEKSFHGRGRDQSKLAGGMLLGYARVSKGDEQNNALQARALKAAGCRKLFEETASGGPLGPAAAAPHARPAP